SAAEGGLKSSRSRRKIFPRCARYIGAASGIHGDPIGPAADSEVGRIDKGRARRIELRHERTAARGGLEGSSRRRKVGGERHSRYVGVATGIHGDPETPVIGVAAEVSGIDEGGAGGIELGDEGAAPAGRLEGSRCRGEVKAGCKACYVSVAGGIHCDPETELAGTGTEVGGVRQHRVDDER